MGGVHSSPIFTRYIIRLVIHLSFIINYVALHEVERDRVVKTYSKESATSKIQWNRQEQEQLKSFKELAVVGNPTRDPRTGETIFQKNLHHRQNGPAGAVFSAFSSSAASHDTSSR